MIESKTTNNLPSPNLFQIEIHPNLGPFISHPDGDGNCQKATKKSEIHCATMT
jgi:hypothetical protein